jgi:hypothetical protein
MKHSSEKQRIKKAFLSSCAVAFKDEPDNEEEVKSIRCYCDEFSFDGAVDQSLL